MNKDIPTIIDIATKKIPPLIEGSKAIKSYLKSKGKGKIEIEEPKVEHIIEPKKVVIPKDDKPIKLKSDLIKKVATYLNVSFDSARNLSYRGSLDLNDWTSVEEYKKTKELKINHRLEKSKIKKQKRLKRLKSKGAEEKRRANKKIYATPSNDDVKKAMDTKQTNKVSILTDKEINALLEPIQDNNTQDKSSLLKKGIYFAVDNDLNATQLLIFEALLECDYKEVYSLAWKALAKQNNIK